MYFLYLCFPVNFSLVTRPCGFYIVEWFFFYFKIFIKFVTIWFWISGGQSCRNLPPQPAIKPVPPALKGKVLTTVLLGKSPVSDFYYSSFKKCWPLFWNAVKLLRISLILMNIIFTFCVQNSLLLLFSHWLFAIPWNWARQASLSFTRSLSLLKLMSTELVMPSNHLTLCFPLLLLPSIFPSIRIFFNELLFTSDGQSIGASASASVLPMNIQGWFHLGLTGLLYLLSKRLSRVFSSTTIWKHQFFHSVFFMVQLTSIRDYWKNRDLTLQIRSSLVPPQTNTLLRTLIDTLC